MGVEVANETDTPVDEAALVDLARYVLDELRIHPQAELSLLLVDVAAMTELNQRWMDQSGPTDVLSFPMDELRPPGDDREPVPGLLGDVVLCPAVAASQARAAGHTTEDELHLLTTHGVLHLLGYDHAEPAEHAEMFGLQAALLDGWRRARQPR